MKHFHRTLTSLFAAALLSVSCVPPRSQHPLPNQTLANEGSASSSERVALGTRGAVASGHDLVSQTGIEILREGGTAIDAAIAMSFMAGVVLPHSTGLGGGGFMLIHQATKQETDVLDFRERAPLKATAEMYFRDGKADTSLSLNGHLAVAVPGTVSGLLEAHQHFATLPLTQLMQPAIEVAKKGFPVYEDLASAIEKRQEVLQRYPASAQVFLPHQKQLKVGDQLVQSDLAATLELIRDQGAQAFYHGSLAKAIVLEMKRGGGILSAEDLDQYQVKKRKPLVGTYRGWQVLTMPPPSSGGVHLIQMLNILEAFSGDQLKKQTTLRYHLLAESMKRAYRDRALFLGDMDFVEVPLERLISKKYGARLAKSISQQRATPHDLLPPSGEPAIPTPRESVNTTHISVVDSDGNAVSTTQTINYGFGSGVMVPGTGILLNNEMDDFSLKPGVPNVYGLVGSEANAIAPGKTPLSSMTPTLVFKDDQLRLVLGSPGGSRIITSVLQVIVNRIDLQLSLAEALSLPRIHHQWRPATLFIEETMPARVISELTRLGHAVKTTEPFHVDIEAVAVAPDRLHYTGASDQRRSGSPRAY